MECSGKAMSLDLHEIWRILKDPIARNGKAYVLFVRLRYQPIWKMEIRKKNGLETNWWEISK